jgi:hypothetical protein
MYRSILWILMGFLAVSCNQTTTKNADQQEAGQREKIVTATIEEMLAAPDDYKDKEVALSGMVTHVCREGGQKCFILASDGETQLRIVTGGDIDEFKIDMEGSTVAFKGIFRVLTLAQAEAQMEDYDSHESHETGQAFSDAEKADYFVEALDFKEITE